MYKQKHKCQQSWKIKIQHKKTEQCYKWQQNADLKIQNLNQPKMGTNWQIRINKMPNKGNENYQTYRGKNPGPLFISILSKLTQKFSIFIEISLPSTNYGRFTAHNFRFGAAAKTFTLFIYLFIYFFVWSVLIYNTHARKMRRIVPINGDRNGKLYSSTCWIQVKAQSYIIATRTKCNVLSIYKK